jgi:inosose dehydratase
VTVLRLAGGPVSWGVDFADAPENPPYGAVLDGIAAAGLEWLELGPVGYLPYGALAGRGLAAVGTFVFDDFHAGADGAVLAATRAALDAIVAAGGTLLVLIDRPSHERAASAGRSDAARRLGAGEWARMVELLRRTADRAAARGVRAVVHPHAGGYLEFEDEIDRLLAAVPHAELGLCLDTGHALYAGSDPAELIRRYAERIEHVHLKDVAEPVRSRGLRFWEAIEAGIFCPVGDGLLDLDALREALAAIGYAGFATVEQDRRPGTAGDPAADLRRSVERLRAAGLGG